MRIIATCLLAFVGACVDPAPEDVTAPYGGDAFGTVEDFATEPLNFPRCECVEYPCDATAFCGTGTVCESGGVCYLSCADSSDCTVPGWDTCVQGHCYPG